MSLYHVQYTQLTSNDGLKSLNHESLSLIVTNIDHVESTLQADY